jgi:hypothetical protein
MRRRQRRTGRSMNSPRLGFRRHLSGQSRNHSGPAGQRTVRRIFRLYRTSRGFEKVLRASMPEQRPPLSRASRGRLPEQ